MKKIIISKNQANIPLKKFLLKTFINLNHIDLYKNNKKNNIKVNKKNVDLNYLLQANDEITLYFDPDKAKLIDIVYQDNNLIIINKPIHMECINNQGNDVISSLKKQLNNNELSLVHRIDTNTNGLLIAAKNKYNCELLQALLKNNEIIKSYQCLVYGHLKNKCDILQHYLVKNNQMNKVSVFEHNITNSKKIITKYQVLKEYDNYSLLDVTLITGRTHQIRAHMNYINHPIVGEKKYTKKEFQKNKLFKHQALTAYQIKFDIKDKNHPLFYLNQKTIKLKDIDFLKKIKIINKYNRSQP